MACNYCEKIEGLPKVDHVLNVGGKQVYKCPMCTEYLMVITMPKSKGYIPPSTGWNPSKGYVGGFGMGGLVTPGGVAGALGIPGAASAKAANATPVKEDTGGPKIIYCGYDPAGIHKMIGDCQMEDYMIDTAQWYIKEIALCHVSHPGKMRPIKDIKKDLLKVLQELEVDKYTEWANEEMDDV